MSGADHGMTGTARKQDMRYLFVGGPGRSGTSFVADRLGAHPQVIALKDIELKIFCEKNGLLDLFHILCESYSPNRAVMALDQFRRMADALIEGRYGQPALATLAPAAAWRSAFGEFAARLTHEGHPVPHSPEAFLAAARALLVSIAELAASQDSQSGDRAEVGDRVFLEKTPHNLLAVDFLARLAPGARFLHVMRDPRSIAWSLLAMRWGPDQLVTAACWVDSYCRAWTAAEIQAAALGLPLVRLHIEEAAATPERAAAWLAARLDLTPCAGLLRGADPAVLNRWTDKASPAEHALLNARLGGWVAHFGYHPTQIGRRPCSGLPPDQLPVSSPNTPADASGDPAAAPTRKPAKRSAPRRDRSDDAPAPDPSAPDDPDQASRGRAAPNPA